MPEVKHNLEIKFGSTYGLEEANALMECLRNNAPSCGKKVLEFEKAFAEYCGVNYAVSVTSATTGLTLDPEKLAAQLPPVLAQGMKSLRLR